MYNSFGIKVTSDDLCFLDCLNLLLINENIETYNFFSFMGDGFIEITGISYYKLTRINQWINENYSEVDYKSEFIWETENE